MSGFGIHSINRSKKVQLNFLKKQRNRCETQLSTPWNSFSTSDFQAKETDKYRPQISKRKVQTLHHHLRVYETISAHRPPEYFSPGRLNRPDLLEQPPSPGFAHWLHLSSSSSSSSSQKLSDRQTPPLQIQKAPQLSLHCPH